MVNSEVHVEVLDRPTRRAIFLVSRCLSGVLAQPVKRLEARAKNRLENGRHFLVALSGERPVGYSEFSINSKAAELHEHAFFVRPEFLGQGIGTRILFELKQWAKLNHCHKIVKELQTQKEMAFAKKAEAKLKDVFVLADYKKRRIELRWDTQKKKTLPKPHRPKK